MPVKGRKDGKGRLLRKGEYYRKDGRYCYSYTNPFGERKMIYANDIVTLRKREDVLKRNQLDGLDIYSAGNATLNELFDRYINSKTDLRPTTMSNYKYMYDHFVRDTFGKNKLRAIKYSDVLYFYNYLLDERGLKVATLDNVHSTLHPAFEMAVRDDLIRTNPTKGVMAEIKKTPGRVKGIRHALTLEQQRHFLEYVEECPLLNKWLPMFTILLGTGMRVGELVGLRWDDVDLDKHMISINHNLSYYTYDFEEERLSQKHISLPKTAAGIRTIPMMPQVFDAFSYLYERQRRKRIRCETIDGMTNFVFRNDEGNVILPNAINDAIKHAIKYHNEEEPERAAEENREPVMLPDFSCHHLRHTFCTRFCEKETNVKVIQAIMGHADIETTMNIYAEVTDDKKTEAMANLAMSVDIF